MSVVINRRLNMVITVNRPDGTAAHVHCAPISRETFEAYQMPLGRAYAALNALGLCDSATGPSMAAGVLKQVATQMGAWDTMQAGLFPEIFRTTGVITPGMGHAMPWDHAISQKILDGDDVLEVTGAVVFFTLTSALNRRSQVADRLRAAASEWGFVTTLLNSTEWAASLQTSTKAAAIGATVAQPATVDQAKVISPSSVPS